MTRKEFDNQVFSLYCESVRVEDRRKGMFQYVLETYLKICGIYVLTYNFLDI